MEKKLSVNLMCRNVKLDQWMQEYILKRVQKMNRFLSKVPNGQAEIEVDRDKKGKFRVEIMLKTPYNSYRAEETSESIEGSTDVAVDNLIRQITSDKDKIKELRERGARSLKKKIILDESARFRE